MISDLFLYVLLPSVALGLAVSYAPMSIFDRYVLRKFSSLFLAAFLFMVALLLVVRLSDKELAPVAERQRTRRLDRCCTRPKSPGSSSRAPSQGIRLPCVGARGFPGIIIIMSVLR